MQKYGHQLRIKVGVQGCSDYPNPYSRIRHPKPLCINAIRDIIAIGKKPQSN
jgi:hypothetical protein